MDIYDPHGKIVASLSRPFYYFFSTISVETVSQKRVGTIEKRFTIFRPLYDICDMSGSCFGKLLGSFFGGKGIGNILLGNQNYSLLDSSGDRELSGGIERQWNGVLNRMFTEKDTYMVRFPENWGEDKKLLLLSAAISIDFDYSENQGDGLLGKASAIGSVAGLLSGRSNND